MKTIIIRREKDEYCATLKDDPEASVTSDSLTKTVGKIILYYPEVFGVNISLEI